MILFFSGESGENARGKKLTEEKQQIIPVHKAHLSFVLTFVSEGNTLGITFSLVYFTPRLIRLPHEARAPLYLCTKNIHSSVIE